MRPQVDALCQALAKINEVEPFRPLSPVFISILGISELAAHVIRAEIGMDISRFARPRTSSSGLASAPTTSMPAPRNSKKNRLVKRLAYLGHAVELAPLPN